MFSKAFCFRVVKIGLYGKELKAIKIEVIKSWDCGVKGEALVLSTYIKMNIVPSVSETKQRQSYYVT